jgi:hypothetical protein
MMNKHVWTRGGEMTVSWTRVYNETEAGGSRIVPGICSMRG